MKSRSNDSAGPRHTIESAEAWPPQLLISVRSEQEIDDAIAGGADIVDLKEPRNGALAPTTVQLWNSVSRQLNHLDAVRFSAALGESQEALSIARSLPSSFAYAKVGPSNCDTAERLVGLWTGVLGLLNPATELVAVAYADHEAANCLPAETVFKLAAEFGFRRCLIDTLVKDGRTTIDHLGMEGLQLIASVAKQNQLWWVLAGSIRLHQVDSLDRKIIQPNCFGVRGDVCEEGRVGSLSTARVWQWKQSCVTRTNQVRSGS
jgi:uncharacterized protein (UPF0264 family)